MADAAFFSETPVNKQLAPETQASATILLSFLLCESCPVRRECLLDALDPPKWTAREDEHRQLGTDVRSGRVFGTWGGTLEAERWPLRDLPPDEAADLLEAMFPERLDRRLAAYRESRERPRPHPVTGVLRTRSRTRRDRRIDELLERRRVKRFHLRGPGPGRGHKGPIALYAEQHGSAGRRLGGG